MVPLIDLKKILSYAFLIGITKNFDIGIMFGFKNTLLKKRITGAGPFHGKVGWSVNCSYFSQFKMNTKEMLKEIIHTILEL